MSEVKKKEVVGILVETQKLLDNKLDIYNSQWGMFTYTVDGKEYLSKNSITIPMRFKVGDTMTIKYNVADPTEIFNKHLFVV